MLKLQYQGERVRHEIEFARQSSHVVQVVGVPEVKTVGFDLYAENNVKLGEYRDFTTIYKSLEDGAMFSDDGSVEPEPVPDPEPEPVPEPTLEEIKVKKITEMNMAQQAIIAAGVTVQLSDGQANFSLKDKDQSDLDSLALKLLQGAEKIPWHENDEDVHCKYYSPADMQIIINAAQELVTYQVTYFRDLRIYINSLESKENVENIMYGIYIPAGYQSEVLQDIYAALGVSE